MKGESEKVRECAAESLEHERFAKVAKALGHSARIKIVEHLAETDRCVCGAIVDVLPLAQSTVSQHLKILKEAGVIRGEVKGPRICYCLNWPVIEAFKAYVAALSPASDSKEEPC
jgi:DNA-binding transcriptional ArsR family regulator